LRQFPQFGLGFPQFSLFDPSLKQHGYVIVHPSRKSSPTAAWTDAVTSYLSVYWADVSFEPAMQPFTKVIGSHARETAETKPELQTDHVANVFKKNRDLWLVETSTYSSLTDIAMHPAYQEIIGLGPDVLPLIFRDLEEQPRFWFWALAAITRHTPDHEEGNFESARHAWLEWAREQGYL
jgi:hypothetical protein